MSESEARQIMAFLFAAGSLTELLLILYLKKDELNWKNGSNSYWSGYLEMMSRRFHNSPRSKQDEYILRMSQICTIGAAALALSFGYPFLPVFARVFMLPLVLVAAWFIGGKLGRRK
jgi:hypothetical protein